MESFHVTQVNFYLANAHQHWQTDLMDDRSPLKHSHFAAEQISAWILSMFTVLCALQGPDSAYENIACFQPPALAVGIAELPPSVGRLHILRFLIQPVLAMIQRHNALVLVRKCLLKRVCPRLLFLGFLKLVSKSLAFASGCLNVG